MQKLKKQLKTAAILLTAAVTAVVPFASKTGGTAFADPAPIIASAEEGDVYKKVAIPMAVATAFEDARILIKMSLDDELKGEREQNFQSNVQTLVSDGRFGNVGLFIGMRGTSKYTDNWSVYSNKVSFDNSSIKVYDDWTGGMFSQYKAFGTAVQDLNSKAVKGQGSTDSVEKGLNELSAAGAKLTNLGTTLLKEYNPAPVLLAFIDANSLNTHPENKLVTMVNDNDNLREIIKIFGTSTSFGVPMSFLILGIIAFIFLISSVLMTLINGRAAGENIRKTFVKFIVGCIAVPLAAKGLDAGVNFLSTAAAVQIATPSASYVEQNLNFADWKATGFNLPSGMTLHINEKGRFVLSPSDVRAINEYTYKQLWGTPTDDDMMERMEMYYAAQKDADSPYPGFSEPVNSTGTREGQPWKTDNFYAMAANLGANKPLAEGIDGNDTLRNVGYFKSSSLRMSPSSTEGMTYDVYVGRYPDGDSSRRWFYGISPIAAFNILITNFSGDSMTVSALTSPTGSVVFNADNGEGLGTAKMDSLTRFIATFSMVMAAMKGLFTLFAAGFGGIMSGGAKSLLGSSSGLGQVLGGIIALVGGIFGISIIMTISFMLLNQLFGVMDELLKGTTAGADILDPFKEVFEGIKLIGGLLGSAMKSVARFVLSILCALTLPKFGGIPITLFCQHLAELPHVMAERAQAIENKFTGDFRGGAGGFGRGGGAMGSASTLANQAMNEGKAQGMAMMAGAGMALSGLAGLGLSKWGEAKEKKWANADTGEGSMAENTKDDDNGAGADATKDAEEKVTPEEALGAAGAPEDGGDGKPENGGKEPEAGKDGDGKEGSPSVPEGGTMVNTENVDGNDLKEVKEESLQATEGDDHTEITGSEEIQSELQQGDEERSMSQEASSLVASSDESGETISESTDVGHTENSSMSDKEVDQQIDSENSAMASSHSEKTTGEAGSKSSMAGSGASSGTSGKAGSSGKATAGNSAAQRSAAAGGNSSGTPSSMAGNGGGPGKKTLTKEQKKARRQQAIGSGLQSLGGHTSSSQAAAAVVAGLAHMGGARVGAQNITQKGVNAVRANKQRQRDIRQGLPPNYSENQRKNTNANTKPGNTPPDGGTKSNPRAEQNARRQNALLAEEMARQAEEANRR